VPCLLRRPEGTPISTVAVAEAVPAVAEAVLLAWTAGKEKVRRGCVHSRRLQGRHGGKSTGIT
jgi:hypothetical protein